MVVVGVGQIAVLLPHLKAESDVRDAFVRMDHNGDGVVDFTDYLMWQERMREGRAKTDFWSLQEVKIDIHVPKEGCSVVSTSPSSPSGQAPPLQTVIGSLCRFHFAV